MSFNPSNFVLQYTDTITGQRVFSYDGGADTATMVQSSGYFPNTLGAVAGDIILANYTESGVPGKALSFLVHGTDTHGTLVTKFYNT